MALVAGIVFPVTNSWSAVANRPNKPGVAGLGIRLVDVPTSEADDPRARQYIIDRLAPGSIIKRRVQVVNDTPAPAQVTVYAAAARIENGDFIGASGHTRNELSTWTTTRPRSLSLAPHGRAFVHVTVQVPSQAPEGERYGVVWAQVTTPPNGNSGVTQVSRVGIRLYLSIGRGGAPASDFAIMSMTAIRDDNDRPVVRANIRNTGGRALDLYGSLGLTNGPGGLSAGPFPITVGTTLGIGQTEPLYVTMNRQLPDGPWLATLTARSGLLMRTARATLTFPGSSGTGATVAAHPVSSQRWWTSWSIRAIAGVLLIFLALILTLVMLRRRRRHDDQPKPSDAPASIDA